MRAGLDQPAASRRVHQPWFVVLKRAAAREEAMLFVHHSLNVRFEGMGSVHSGR
ncbi:MAG: hypothetical protein KTR25_09675 [Myxococcales bacterium]|nr:hypothetical protein [Myxococcales bacterium]